MWLAWLMWLVGFFVKNFCWTIVFMLLRFWSNLICLCCDMCVEEFFMFRSNVSGSLAHIDQTLNFNWYFAQSTVKVKVFFVIKVTFLLMFSVWSYLCYWKVCLPRNMETTTLIRFWKWKSRRLTRSRMIQVKEFHFSLKLQVQLKYLLSSSPKQPLTIIIIIPFFWLLDHPSPPLIPLFPWLLLLYLQESHP